MTKPRSPVPINASEVIGAILGMRGDVIYRVYGLHEGREKEHFFGAFRTTSEANAEMAKLCAMEMNGRNWAEQYHNKGFVIREAVVDTDFEIPSQPKPRDKYAVKALPNAKQPGRWETTVVEVFRRKGASGELEKICEYERNYSLLQTFEPFRQGSREFALISRDYTKTAVLDLASGNIIAEESDEPGNLPGGGFCPVGFYVPDWWDVHAGLTIPGSEHWNRYHEWPRGDFGFVWGCLWGDDSSWKIQYFDLRQVQQGILKREERFGYVELATSGFRSPCLSPESNTTPASAPPHFIQVSRHDGVAQVILAVEMTFGLESGKSQEWQRLRIANWE